MWFRDAQPILHLTFPQISTIGDVMSKSLPDRLSSGANLPDCQKIALRLGCTIEHTGEIRFSHSMVKNSVRVNGRRKGGAPRALTVWLNRILYLASLRNAENPARAA